MTANKPNDPCAAESNTLIPISIGTNPNILSAPTANAVTTVSASQSTAFGSVNNSTANVGLVQLKADVIEANAAATCVNGQAQLTGSSSITNLTARVLGVPISVPINPAPNTVLINVLGVKVTLNEQTTVNGEKTIRAIHIAAPGLNTDVVIAEARADAHGTPCATTPPPTPQCSDGVDNADPEDTAADKADPGCHSDQNPYNDGSYDPNDNDESNTPHQCNDGVDNADPEDTLVDKADPGCHSDGNAGNPGSYVPTDDDETDVAAPKPQCSDGVDNADPEDTAADKADAGCHSDGNPGNDSSYNPNDNDETNGGDCADGKDNDGDLAIDAGDPQCHTDGNPKNTGSYRPGRFEAGN